MAATQRTPIEIDARREALRLAAQHGGDTRMIVDRARAYIDFIFAAIDPAPFTAEQEARIREIAVEEADKVRPIIRIAGERQPAPRPSAKIPPHDGGSFAQ